MKNFYSFILFFTALLFYSQSPVTLSSGTGTWTVPCDVTSITFEVWGAGGSGQNVSGVEFQSLGSGGGGSGGGFVKATYTVTPGATYTYVVGAGGTGGANGTSSTLSLSGTTVLRAAGGIGAGSLGNGRYAITYGTGAAAPATASNTIIGGTATVSTRGGSGATPTSANNASGGGGSSAGSVNGNNASFGTGGLAPTNGYAGANGIATGNQGAGLPGAIGAGGSGGRANINNQAQNGGAGGNGQIKISYTSSFKTYCPKNFTLRVEPITYVNFAGINNTTSNVINATPALESFCVSANVSRGNTYTISVRGNTGGVDYTSYFRVYFDWNQSGTFDADEFYNIGSIVNSDGSTKTAVTSITVPAGALLGNTRMRVVKNFNQYTDACSEQTYGQAEDYTVNIVSGACATPGVQPTALSLTQISSSQINGSFTAASPAPNNYLVVRNTTGIAPSPAPVNETSYAIGSTALGGTNVVVDNDGNTSFSATGLTPITTYYFYIYSFNSLCSGGPLYLGTSPLSGSISLPQSYCAANVNTATQSAETYIQKVRFLGTLNDVLNDQAAGSRYATAAPFGYQNYTTLPNKTRQAIGNGINVYVESNSIVVNGAETNDSSYMAWIDWNKDGDFDDPKEEVYNSNALVLSTTFGIIIPTDPTIIPYGPGDYRLRIRINKRGGGGAPTSCNTIDFAGETEDYVIEVIANCSAVVTSVGKIEDQSRCGPGVVSLTAAASAGGVTGFRWYTAETGGTLVGTSTTADGITTTWPTPSINTTTTYYVEAYNGSCPSLVRIPVLATIKLVPNVAFTPSVAESCGKSSVITLSAVGGNEVDYLINENFEAGGLGTFSNERTGPDYGTTINSRSAWQSLSSVNFPVNYGTGSSQTWFPALSSGVNGNKFVMASSDIGQISSNNPRVAENALVSQQFTGITGVADYLNLTLNFKMYYSRYHPDGTLTAKDYVNVQVATNAAGDNWTTIPQVGTYDNGNIITDKGIGTKFQPLAFNLNAYAGQAFFKMRIVYHGEWCDGVAIDDVQLFGEKKLKPSFTWDPGVNPLNFYTDAGATTLYTQGTPIEAVYIRPTLDQMESASSWNVSATATLGNGCPVAGNITVTNSNKIWNSASADWSDSSKWKPSAVLPNLNTCVIVRSPLTISNGDGIARNISIEPAGSLTIKKDRTLTVTDYIKNESTPLASNETNFIVETDGNLIQTNNGAANSGRMTAQRNVTGLRYNPGTAVDYVYWGSPVAGQQTKGAGGFSPGTPNNRFFYYRESNDYFYETGDLTFTPGRGYAVQAETNKGSSFNRLFEFKGTPNNGDIAFNITRSADNPTGVVHGYNLVGNPYPSNISFDQLYAANSALIYKTLWFWTNGTYTPDQQGSNYSGNNYAVYNGTGGTAATVPANVTYSSVVPTGIVKVGQAFLVQKKIIGTDPLNFKNSYGAGLDLRVSTAGTFYSRGQETKDRFWLKLQSPDNLINSQLIGYIAGATDGFEMDFDAEAFSMSSNLFYSLLGNQKLLIQGKGPAFTQEDKISLGANFYQNGIYTISLESAEGIFENNQSVYLKDRQAGILTNLNQGNYTFSATSGDTASRFEIVYKPEMVLAVGANSKDELTVYREGNEFIVNAQNKKISSVEVFDVSGRLIYSASANSLRVSISLENMVSSVYVLKINQGGQITTKKIKK